MHVGLYRHWAKMLLSSADEDEVILKLDRTIQIYRGTDADCVTIYTNVNTEDLHSQI